MAFSNRGRHDDRSFKGEQPLHSALSWKFNGNDTPEVPKSE